VVVLLANLLQDGARLDRFGDAAGDIGPDLDLKLPSHTRASLSAKILVPGVSSLMPSDFGARMSDAELDALVTFLLAATPSR
jgi:hypothetical protein